MTYNMDDYLRPAPKPEATVRDEEYRAFIRSLRCLPCKQIGIDRKADHACHYRTRRNHGDHENLWPGCNHHHAFQHLVGIVTFQQLYVLDLEQRCKDYQAIYDSDPKQELDF